MPTMANIVVKAANGTTDVTYTAVAGSAGDKSPAIWRNDAVGTTPAERPLFTIASRDNGTKDARRMDHTYVRPLFLTDALGRKVRNGGPNGFGTLLIPQTMTPTDIAEMVHEYTGLLASALIRAAYKEGMSPRG